MIEGASPIANSILLLMQLLVVGAALQDTRRLKISNLFPIGVIGCFVVWVALIGIHITLWENLVAFILTLAAGLVLFSRNWLGGGDVKLLAAVALWFNLANIGHMLCYIAVSGMFLTLAFIFVRRMLPAYYGNWVALRRRGPIPYGIAIAAGAVIAIQLGNVSPKPPSSMQKYQEMGLFMKKQA